MGMKLLAVVILACVSFCAAAGAYEGRRANSVLLNGTWEYVVGDGGEGAETPAGQAKLLWQQATLPGPFMEWSEDAATQIKFVWAKRTFDVSREQAEGLGVLRWNHIDLGAVAFINGRKVGENEPTGPYQVVLPKGILKPGENEIVLRIPGAQGVRKAKSGFFLIPAGFASCHKRGLPAVTDDIWIDFADAAYMKWVLAIPDLTASKVGIRVTPTGLEPADDLRITVAVKPWPDGPVIGRGEAPARLVPDPDPLGGGHFSVDVPMPGFKPWTYEECNLYTADVQLTKNGKVLDTLSLRFGMREIGVAESNYKLNGRNLRLRGSNLVFEWNWGDVITGKEKDYLVTEAREMSLNSFRTHTQPPPRLWADICDEHGTMILAEFRCLYNYRDYGFTPDEYAIWHRNVISDAAGWMSRLWNHPSVIMWVLSNESRRDNEWEEGPYQDFVLELDPTRPTLRTGTSGTKHNYDVHTCSNVTRIDEGHLEPLIPGWFGASGGRTTTNTEYMNVFNRSPVQWVGRDDKDADRLAVAQVGMEHTEAMRRARLDGIWPYMYAGWTRTRRGGEVWKGGYATPLSACWHSSLSPVLASLDLFDPNYFTGQEVTTDLHLINDSWHDASIHVDLLLTRDSPEFIPEAECFDAPIAKWSFDFDLPADSISKTPITWRLPDEQGNYWLTARTTGLAGRPVLSQRFVRAVKAPEVPDAAKRRTVVVLGGGASALGYFESRGLSATSELDSLQPDRHVVIIWNAAQLNVDKKQAAQALCDFAAAGGRVVVLSTGSWDWPELCDVEVPKSGPFSRAFAHEGMAHPLLSGIDREWLMRWNGLPGTVAVAEIKGPALENAEKIIWAREQSCTVAAEVPTADGRGKVLFCQLDIQRHLDRTKPTYDPVAERVLLNLLAG
jgi:hypothetical protein